MSIAPTLSLPLFLSLVVPLRNRAEGLEPLLIGLAETLQAAARDWEIIIVDNGSDDGSIERLQQLMGREGIANLQVFALTGEVDPDTAIAAGLERSLGDFVCVLDPASDTDSLLGEMATRAVDGADMVFATNLHAQRASLAYRVSNRLFNRIYQGAHGVALEHRAPPLRLLSRRVVNFILQHPLPAVAYRHLPASAGFSRVHLEYRGQPPLEPRKHLLQSIERGMRLLVSTTRIPLRLVTALCLFGAFANLMYSGYVIAVALLRDNVAAGWVTLSLQQSGMFLLISLVLLVLSEYILHLARMSSEGPAYHVGRELTSMRMTRRERLNVEDSVQAKASLLSAITPKD